MSAAVAIAASGALALLSALHGSAAGSRAASHIEVEVHPVPARRDVLDVLAKPDPVYTIRAPGQEVVLRGWDLDGHLEAYAQLFRGLRGAALTEALSHLKRWLEAQPWPLVLYRGTRTDDVLSAGDVTDQEGPHRSSHWTTNRGIAARFAQAKHSAAWGHAGRRHGQIYRTVVGDLGIVHWPNTIYMFHRYTFHGRPPEWMKDEPEEEINLKIDTHAGPVVLQQALEKSR